jgi:hypothetical protein
MLKHINTLSEIAAIASGVIMSNYTVYYILSDTCKYNHNIMKETYEKRIKELEELVKINI